MITADQKRRIREYFAYHGDTNIQIVKQLPSRYDVPVALVRVRNMAGKQYSVIVNADSDGDWFELYSAQRENEENMIKTYMEQEDEDCD